MQPGGSRSLLVIGGTGFFGKSMLDAFRRGLLAPWGITRVLAAARRPDKLRIDCPELIGPGVELIELDITTASSLPVADYVIHAANTTDARRYADDPMRERATITSAALRFAKLIPSDAPDARIVYCSSGAVYGAQPRDVIALRETDPPAPLAGLVAYKRDYAEAKREAEAIIAGLGEAHDTKVAVARCFAFVGPYLPRDQHFAIGNFLADAMAGDAVVVHARHPVVRSYMYADDLARWLMTIADHASPACPIYNVGSDEAIEVTALAERVASRFGVPAALPPIGEGEADRYVPSIARATGGLGLTLWFDLDQALDAVIGRLRNSSPHPPGTRRG